jgi:hypothetical protein
MQPWPGKILVVMLLHLALSCAFLVFLGLVILFPGGESGAHGFIKTGLHLHLSLFRDHQGDHHWRKLIAHLRRKRVSDGAIKLAADSDLANTGERMVEKAWLSLLFAAHSGASFFSHFLRSLFQISMYSSCCAALSRSKQRVQQGDA